MFNHQFLCTKCKYSKGIENGFSLKQIKIAKLNLCNINVEHVSV